MGSPARRRRPRAPATRKPTTIAVFPVCPGALAWVLGAVHVPSRMTSRRASRCFRVRDALLESPWQVAFLIQASCSLSFMLCTACLPKSLPNLTGMWSLLSVGWGHMYLECVGRHEFFQQRSCPNTFGPKSSSMIRRHAGNKRVQFKGVFGLEAS